jgi:hypothetical protein
MIGRTKKWLLDDAEVPVTMSDFVLHPQPPDKKSTSTDPATAFFTERLRECYEMPVIDPSTGRLVRINSNTLSKFLKDYADEDDARTLATATFYRIEKGLTSPRIDMVYAIAKAFGVPPSSFLPDQTDD